jgi:hypothetical protein
MLKVRIRSSLYLHDRFFYLLSVLCQPQSPFLIIKDCFHVKSVDKGPYNLKNEVDYDFVIFYMVST